MKRTHRDDTNSSSVESVTGLAAEQREALAKIYRLLLSLKKRGTNNAGAVPPQAPVDASRQEERQQLVTEPLDK